MQQKSASFAPKEALVGANFHKQVYLKLYKQVREEVIQ